MLDGLSRLFVGLSRFYFHAHAHILACTLNFRQELFYKNSVASLARGVCACFVCVCLHLPLASLHDIALTTPYCCTIFTMVLAVLLFLSHTLRLSPSLSPSFSRLAALSVSFLGQAEHSLSSHHRHPRTYTTSRATMTNNNSRVNSSQADSNCDGRFSLICLY